MIGDEAGGLDEEIKAVALEDEREVGALDEGEGIGDAVVATEDSAAGEEEADSVADSSVAELGPGVLAPTSLDEDAGSEDIPLLDNFV